MMKTNLRYWVLALAIIGVIFISGCVQQAPASIPTPQPTPDATQLQPSPQQPQEKPISVETFNSKYKTVSTKPSGSFATGQDADIMLSGIDFNNAGGPLLFNHPGNVASDGTRLILADRNNNRVLIWNNLPTGNTAPDLVLGQNDFTSNNPGSSLDKLNWPVGVATAGGKLAVADTYNHRVLIWNFFPTKNGQPADFELKEDAGWPWAVWTDGEKLVVTATGKAKVSIWNSFPAGDRAADISIHLPGKLGTPRSVASDGKHLIIGDHNAFGNKQGTFFWKTFPTQNNQMYDFFVAEIPFMGGSEAQGKNVNQQNILGSLLWGPTMTSDGKLIGIANQLYIWDSFPENENDKPDLSVGSSRPGAPGYDFGGSQSGDGSGVAVAGSRLYVSLSNGNKIAGFNTLPTRAEQNPDFAIGSSINENTLKTNYFITNPVPATDGKSLFVMSNFDSTLSVWKLLPDESGANPDFVYTLMPPPGGIAIIDGSLVVSQGKEALLWKKLPLNGELPDEKMTKIGGVEFAGLGAMAKDDKYFYAADIGANKIYVWEGNPLKDSSVLKFTISVTEPVGAFSSDGNYLLFSISSNGAKFYKISELPNPKTLETPGRRFNLPGGALLHGGRLFVADTVFNRVQIWNSVENAIAGKEPDAVLGQSSLAGTNPSIGGNRLFWPGGLAFDGGYLWVGEYKFSGRVVRFSVK